MKGTLISNRAEIATQLGSLPRLDFTFDRL